MRNVSEYISNLSDGRALDIESYYYVTTVSLMDQYEDYLNTPYECTDLQKAVSLSRFLEAAQGSFISKFKAAIDKSPGVRLYLITHTVFDIDDNRSRDWLTTGISDILIPTEKDFYDWEHMGDLPKGLPKILDIFNPIGVNDYDDEILIRFGIWNRDESGRLTDPILVEDTSDFRNALPKRSDVSLIINQAGVLNLATGEIVITD